SPLGIVHRDMSPQNIFVTYEGTTKVLDFGIAKALNQPVHTRVGGVKGKIQYMSPEQARGGSNIVDRRSDVFTMGVLLWEAAVGRRLWKGENESVIFQRLVRGDTIPTPRSANSLVHPRIDRICTRALSVDREKRYATAEELRLDVEDYMVQAGLRISSLDVGRFLSERFCQEREAMRATIDAELRNTSASLKVVTTSTRAGSTGRNVSTSTNSQPATALAPPAASPTRYWKHAAFGLGGAILVAFAFWGLTSRVPPVAPATSQIPVIPPPANPVVQPVAAQPMVNLSIDVVPATARVYLDDRLLGTGAFRGRVDRSPGAHRLRAEALGHKSTTTEISLESDSTVQLALTPEAAGARSNKKAEHPSKPATASAPSEPQTGSKRKPAVVSIDTENPW
ncbi:MAG TPA: serine/threonine-protein kinase, partial [Polyangiaceae bacterium]|nr:serine/threonine-protein kinase [Polyangiaceae bacterium]